MPAKSIMIQGTGSGVGKSIMVAALCRIFRQDGFKVAPYKSQNMSLNSYVTESGGEIARAQVVQAQAAGIEPTVDMNPILLKPSADHIVQVIIHGKPYRNMTAKEYQDFKEKAFSACELSLDKLKSNYDVVVIEGAGSPAEINLQKWDIVNMRISRLANAPVLLVGDIDRGGVFASLIGTLELLPDPDEKLISGFIINKFRGDIDLLTPGLQFLEERAKRPVLGVIPYFHDIWIEEEDSLPSRSNPATGEKIKISVIWLPHISNFTDFDALEREPNIALDYIKNPRDLDSSDLIIIPGTKNTISDLAYLRQLGLDQAIVEAAKQDSPIIGICGGFQMLGRSIVDTGFESKSREVTGLQILDVHTCFQKDKVTARVQARITGADCFFDQMNGQKFCGYEIHMGESMLSGDVKPAFKILARNGAEVSKDDGAISKDGLVLGTYIHGLFESASLRQALLNFVNGRKDERKSQKKWEQSAISDLNEIRERELDRLANLVRENLNMKDLYQILERE